MCCGAAAGGGLLQRSLQGSGELRDGVHAGKDPERLEEAGSDENILLCCYCTCACLMEMSRVVNMLLILWYLNCN